jgi:hypothetical protein
LIHWNKIGKSKIKSFSAWFFLEEWGRNPHKGIEIVLSEGI